MMGGCYKQLLYIIFFAGFTAHVPAAAPALCTVFCGRSSFYITKMRNSYYYILLFYQIFNSYFVVKISNFCFPFVAKFIFYFFQLIYYQFKTKFFAAQKFL